MGYVHGNNISLFSMEFIKYKVMSNNSKDNSKDSTKLTNKELKRIVKDLNDDNFSYTRDIVYSGNTFSILTATTLNNDLILDTELNIDLLYDEKYRPREVILSAEEQVLNNIRIQSDYVENKYYEGNYINYIIESPSTINKIVKVTFLYDGNHRDKGIHLEIL